MGSLHNRYQWLPSAVAAASPESEPAAATVMVSAATAVTPDSTATSAVYSLRRAGRCPERQVMYSRENSKVPYVGR